MLFHGEKVYVAKQGEVLDFEKIKESFIFVPPSSQMESDLQEEEPKKRERKEPRRKMIKFDVICNELKKRKIFDDNLEIISHDDLFELNETKSIEWASEINENAKKSIFKILSEINTRRIPITDGSRGITLKEKVLFSDIFPFLLNFMPDHCKFYLMTPLAKDTAYYGKKYLHVVWDIHSMDEIKENFLSTFKNLQVSTETLWIHHPDMWSTFLKYDNPRTVEEIYFFFRQGEKMREKRKEYNMKNFGTNTSKTRRVRMVVGEVPYGKKRRCNFRISFTLNWQVSSERFIGGDLQVRYFQEVYSGGFLQGEFANDDEEEEVEKLEEISDEVLEDISQEDAISIVYFGK